MINFDDHVNENRTEDNRNSRSSIQNINNRQLRIWKNKCVIEFNRKPTRN